MALGTGVHNLSLVVRAHNRASRGLASVGRDLDLLHKTRHKVQQGFATMASVGLFALKALAVGAAVAIAGAIVAFSKFDAAMTESLAIVAEVSPEIRTQLENVARSVAKTTKFSATEAAVAYYELLSAGFDVAQAMKALPVVAEFAQAGLFDLKRATELLVTSQKALGLSFKDPNKNMKEQQRIADVLTEANNLAVGEIEDFAEALTNRAAAAMKIYGIEVEEGVAVLAAWAEQGLKGKTAGEAFAIVTRDLQKAALKEADAWRDVNAAVFDGQGNLRNIADIIGDLEAAFVGLSDAQKKQLLSDLGFQERSQARLLQLIGTSDAIRDFEKAFMSASGTTAEVAAKQLDTAIAQLGLLKSSIVDIFIGAGKEADAGFVDVIKRIRAFVDSHAPALIEGAGRFADGVAEFATNVARLRSHFLLLINTGKSQPLFIGFSDNAKKIVGWIDKIIEGWQKLSKPVQDSIGDWAKLIPWIFLGAGALKAVAVVLALIGGPATIVAGIIAGLIILFKHLWENNEEFREGIMNLVDEFKQNVVPVLQEGWQIIQTAVASVLEWFNSDALPFLIELWEQIKQTFAAAWQFIVDLFTVVSELVSIIWENWGETILGFISTIWEMIKGVILGAWQIIEGIFKVFSGILTMNWEKVWEGILDILRGAWEIIWNVIKGAWNLIWGFLKGAWEVVTEVWSGLWNGLKGIVSTAWNIFTGWIEGIWNTFTGWWSDSWESLKSAVGDIFSDLGSVLKAPFNAVISIVENLINTAIGGLNSLISVANKVPGVNISSVGNVSLPRLALGGEALRQGLALVGERGPEIIRLAKGAQVIPLNASNQAGVDVGPAMHVENVNFYGTPQQMLEDYRRETKLALRGL